MMLQELKQLTHKTYGRIVLGKWHWVTDRNLVVGPQAKRSILLDFQARYRLETLVETGTFRGDTVEACRGHFAQIFSIELSPELSSQAQARFSSVPGVEILQGDSGLVLPALLSRIKSATLFWLDGHYSRGVTARGKTDTPIVSELNAILSWNREDHCILIDDARLFTGLFGYPRIQRIEALAERHQRRFEVQNDIIRIYRPPSTTTE